MMSSRFKAGKMVSTLAVVTALGMSSPSFADDIRLTSPDGKVDLVGELVEFNGTNYIIRTNLGDLRMSATRVTCEGAGCPTISLPQADVQIIGSETVGLGLMQLLLSGYASSQGAEVTQAATGSPQKAFTQLTAEEGFGDPIGSFMVTSSNSDDAFATLLDRSADIAMSSRRIRPIEARALRDADAGNMIDPSQEHIIAIDSLIVIAHPDNPVDTLTTDQLRGIYAGTITNWAEVGGADASIQIVDRPEGSATRDIFESRLFGATAPAMPDNAIIVANSNEMAATVNAYENAIGFVGFAFQRGAKPISLVNECGLTMTPDAFSARTEEYALQRFLYLYNRDDLAEVGEGFVDYAVSNAADEVITKSGFIDLGVDRRTQPLDGDRAEMLRDPSVDAFEAGIMQQMLSQMEDYDRLSTTFRFGTGSSTLNPRGVLNLARLTDYLEAQPRGTRLLFVGFTDDVGPFESNQTLSIGRAEQVMAQLQNFAGSRLSDVEMRATGFGEIAPAACNTNENGRATNRRVEVWISSANG